MKGCLRKYKYIIFPLVLMLLSITPLCSQNKTLGYQNNGKYAIGFKSFWLIDHSRSFIYKNSRSSRPLLVNVWYPSINDKTKNRMTNADYLKIPKSGEIASELPEDYKHYNLEILAYQLFGKSLGKFSPKEKILLDEFLQLEHPIKRNSKAIKSKFPLIIYHQGFEASFEDNSVLAYFLASHGYVVVGSSFFGDKSLSVDVKFQSLEDIKFLKNYASKHLNIDTTKIAFIGHSGGAQASILAKSNTDNTIKAVIALETTQELFGISDSRWEDFTKPVIQNLPNMNSAILAFSNHLAVFHLYDLMTLAERIYITFPNSLNHNEYISQGIYANAIKNRLLSGGNKNLTDFLTVDNDAKNYLKVNNFILNFLEWKLNKDSVSENSFQETSYTLPIDYAYELITTVPKGTNEPKAYQFDPNKPIQPRQVWYLARTTDIDYLISILSYYYSKDVENPIYHDLFGFSLISELIEENKLQNAQRFLDFYKKRKIPIIQRFLSISKFSLMMNKPDYSQRCLLNLLTIDPENIQVKKAIQSIGAINEKE